jgi:hypothetical protein
MKTSERLDRKRRRPKPRSPRNGRSFFLKPWFLKWLIVDAVPMTTKVVEMAIKAYDLIKNFWN